MIARIVLRAVARDEDSRVTSIIEQEMPAQEHQIFLALRRDPFKRLIARAILEGGAVELHHKLPNR